MSMRTGIPDRAVPVHYIIPTGFAVQVLRLKPGIEPTDQPPVGNQVFPTGRTTLGDRLETGNPLFPLNTTLRLFRLCPLMRKIGAFRYFWPSRGSDLRHPLVVL
jgi:hypothetical protein